MIALKSLLFHLVRPEVSEIAVASDRNPCARVEGEYEPIGPIILSTDDILQLLFNAGGSRHVDVLGPKPTHWTTRVEGVGPIAVSALMHGDVVHARFSIRTRDTQAPGTPGKRASDPGELAEGAAQRQSSLPSGSRPPPPATAPLNEPAGAMSFELDFTDRKSPSHFPRAGSSIPPAPVELRAATIGRVSPLSPTEPKGNVARRVSPYIPGDSSPPQGPARPITLPGDSSPPQGPIRTMTQSSAVAVRSAATADTVRAPRTTTPTTPQRVAQAAPSHERLWKDLLLFARRALASDLHIIAERSPLVRVGGRLIPQGEPIEAQICSQMLIARVPVRLAPALTREGSVDFGMEEPGLGRFRVNVSRQRTGLKASLRLIPAEIPTLVSLGLPEAIGLALRHHQGLIVLSGPTGHGKTTTLAAIVDLLNQESACHIVTVEDPVEFVHPRKRAMVSQREVGTHTRSFQAALKAALREDPDVIVVGELRDTETVRMALAASETGHLVLGTMNTPSAARTIERLIDLFPPADQAQVRVTLASGLRLIVSQKLIPSPDEMRMVAAAEVLPGSVPLSNLIRESKTHQIPSLQQRGRALGVVRLDDSLTELLRLGKVTLPAALSIAESPDELETAFRNRRTPPPNDAVTRALERGSVLAPAVEDRKSTSQLSEPFIDSQPPPPPSEKSKGLLERASALFGKRGV